MISLKDIYWAAGFLEGEGSFRSKTSSPEVSAEQVQKQPLERLTEFFGGRIYIKKRSPNPKVQPCWRWSIRSSRAIGLMMTLYALMSPKRKLQIYNGLRNWRSKIPAARYRTHCPKGHPLPTQKAFLGLRGGRRCRKCAKEYREKHRRIHPDRRRSISKSQTSFEF